MNKESGAMSGKSNAAQQLFDHVSGAASSAFRALDRAALIARIEELVETDTVMARCLDASRTGVFMHPDGRTDPLLDVRMSPAQLGLLSILAEQCPAQMSVEFGFGMGSSTTAILATRRRRGEPFRHIVFDAFGLAGRGEVVEDFLRHEFGRDFERRNLCSEIGGPALVSEAGEGSCGMVFVDGCHRFENVVTDFVTADHLCCLGGFVVFDDVLAPAVECAVNYIANNRPDYALYSFEADSLVVLQKVARDEREWSDFQPFETPVRSNWTLKQPSAARA